MEEYYFELENDDYIKSKKGETSINRIVVEQLHGNKNLSIDIYNNCLIIVGDNGFGKTSLLNIVCSVISGNIKYLRDINFQAVSIYFTKSISGISESIKVEKKDLEIFDYFHSEIVHGGHKNIHNRNIRNSTRLNENDNKYLRILDNYYNNVESSAEKRYMLLENKEFIELYKEVVIKMEEARRILGFETLFLPTYRRIEQRSEYFGLNEIEDENINFGMNDVKIAIKKITDNIIQSSIDWISKVNGQIINEILDIESKITYFSKYEEKNIRKTLGRIDKKYLKDSSQDKIFDLIDNGKIYNNRALVYFLKNMLKLHEEQSKNDNKLIRFSQICNKYLKNKKIKYDEIKVSLKIVRTFGKKEEYIDFDSLSSGEKQIISIFARLILTEDKNIAVIFDEPEISISITWQKMILEDIYNLDNC